MKIRTRFTLLFSVIVGVILFFFSFSIYYLSENYRQNDFHSRLHDRGIVKLKLFLSVKDSNSTFSNPEIDDNEFHTINQEAFAFFDHNRMLLYHDKNATIPSQIIVSKITSENPYLSNKNNIESIGFTYNFNNNKYYVVSSGYDKHGMSYIDNLKQILFFRGFVLMLVIFISGWLYAGRFLKPISNIVQQASKINYSNMYQRLNSSNSNDEIGQLTTTFNKMLERLEKSFNAQKRFVSNASHELRNPLTAINGQIDVALMKERENEEYKKVLHTISKDIKNIRTLINNLLELANNDEVLIQHFEDIRIDEILWEVREEILKINPEYSISIHFENLLDNDNFLICKGDKKLLETAFLNVIDNACKFSENKTVEVKIISTKSNIILHFIDQGIGMPDSFLNQIFEPFARGSNTIGIQGNGIGLSLVYRIIKLHSGKIFIRSQVNKGTDVEIVLPNIN